MPVAMKNALIGIFVIIAGAIIIFMIMFIHPSVGDNAKTLRVRFTNVDKINVGTRVTYAGHPVGEVKELFELPDARTNRVARNGEVYVYELVLKVDSGVNVYNTDDISSRTSGLLGEKSVEITPRPLKPGHHLILVNDEILYAMPQTTLEETLKQFGDLSTKVGSVLDDFHESMASFKDAKIIDNAAAVVNNVLEVTDSLARNRTLDRLANDYSALANHAANTVGSYRDAGRHLDQIFRNVLEGKGTVGQLFSSNDLYMRIKSLFFKGETIMNDIKNYGILFQNDKRWQRVQARRLRLLEKLSTPEQFACHFGKEIEQVSDALSNVTTVLNETGGCPQSLLNDPQFSYRFGQLLKRVADIEDSLNMYNEQVVDQANQTCPCPCNP